MNPNRFGIWKWENLIVKDDSLANLIIDGNTGIRQQLKPSEYTFLNMRSGPKSKPVALLALTRTNTDDPFMKLIESAPKMICLLDTVLAWGSIAKKGMSPLESQIFDELLYDIKTTIEKI